MHCSEAEVKDGKLLISTERLYFFQLSIDSVHVYSFLLMICFYISVLNMD